MWTRYFRIAERGSSWTREVLGGVTTFATMAYIIVVNPAILAFAGLPTGPSTVATILASVVGCLLMGFYANRPLAVAPYMGENAFLAFGLAALGISWQMRLGAVFVAGLLFLLLTSLRLREWLAASISPSMRCSFAVGIGLFLAFIGLYETGVVRSSVAGQPTPPTEFLANPAVPVMLGDLHDIRVQLSLASFVTTVVLLQRRVRGAILLGIILTALAGAALGVNRPPQAWFALPFTGDYTLAPVALQLDIGGILRPRYIPVLLTLLLMGFLDTLGSLVGIDMATPVSRDASDSSMRDGEDLHRPMVVDAFSCMASALLGTSTSGAYIESAAGIREGARTGAATIVTGLLFACSLFFIPTFTAMQELKYAYGPALVVVGIMMMEAVKRIDFEDITEAAPAFITLVMIVFSYSIANGLTMGLVLHPLLKLLGGRHREVHPGGYLLAAVCLLYYLIGHTH